MAAKNRLTGGFLQVRREGGGYHPAVSMDDPGFASVLDVINDVRVELSFGTFYVRKERRRNGFYWYAYKRECCWFGKRKLRKAYIGASQDFTHERLIEAAHKVLGNSY